MSEGTVSNQAASRDVLVPALDAADVTALVALFALLMKWDDEARAKAAGQVCAEATGQLSNQ